MSPPQGHMYNEKVNRYLQEFIRTTFRDIPASALDLGAGDNSDVHGLQNMGWKCVGVDIRTGTDLEKPYDSGEAPFDLVFSNYVLHKLKAQDQLLNTAYRNLKKGGWFFLHTFDKTDPVTSSHLDQTRLRMMLKKSGFSRISTRLIRHRDTDPGHDHWHIIIEATAKK